MLRKQNPLMLFGLSALAGFMAAGAIWGKKRRRNERKKPLPRNPRKAYKAFHWGNEPDRVREVDVPETPRDLVELGDLQSVTYATNKGGEEADYFHDFGKRGRRRPTLAYDPDGRGLHIVGGAYTVEDRGIVD